MNLISKSGIFLFSLLAFAQNSPPTKPRLWFEVASIKISSGDLLQTAPQRAAGRVRWTTTLPYLVGYAFGIPSWRIGGQISSKEIYVIDATLDPAAGEDQVRAMFQSLLEDRFKMTSHRAQRDANGYALSMVKKGSKIQPAKADDPATALDGRVVATAPARGVQAITGRRASIGQLCEALARTVETFVLDETGMHGAYDFVLQFASENAGADVEVASLFRAIQEDLGLKLEKKRGSIEVLVVDHVETIPTEN